MIPLYISNNDAVCVWNSDDWLTLHSKYHICGSFIGSIATLPRQNDFLGLPMVLMDEEVALLLEKEICQLFSLPNLTKEPTESDKISSKEYEKRLIEEQTVALKKRKIENMSQKIDIIMAGKRKKMMIQGISDSQIDKEAIIQEEISKMPPIATHHLLVHLPTEQILDTEQKKVQIEEWRPTLLSGEGAARYAIYKDLWEKGHFITDGLKFGADFLVYPGDPVRFHAMYMVRCISKPTELFRPPSLVAFGRLSVAVNKLSVLASCDADGRIHYQTLQWHDSVNG